MIILIKIFRLLYNLSDYLIGPKYYEVPTQDFIIEDKFKIRVYGISKSEVKSILIYYHGGGWIAGSIKAYDRMLRYICFKSNHLCIAVDYRKAPENKFPIPFYDTVIAYEWILKNLSTINGNHKEIVLCGDSAGGNLIINLCNYIHKHNFLINPKKLILIYPVVEKFIRPKIRETYIEKIIFYISESTYNFFKNQYFDDNFHNKQEYLSFHKFGSKKAICNYDILIITAKYDSLTYSLNKFANELIKYGNNVKVKEYSNVIHGFINFMSISIQAKRAVNALVDYLNSTNKKF